MPTLPAPRARGNTAGYLVRLVDLRTVARMSATFSDLSDAAPWLDRLGAYFDGAWFFVERDGERLRCDVRTADYAPVHPADVVRAVIPAFFGEVRSLGCNPRVRAAYAEVTQVTPTIYRGE